MAIDGRLAGVREHLMALKSNEKQYKSAGEALKNTLFSQKRLNNLMPIIMIIMKNQMKWMGF